MNQIPFANSFWSFAALSVFLLPQIAFGGEVHAPEVPAVEMKFEVTAKGSHLASETARREVDPGDASKVIWTSHVTMPRNGKSVNLDARLQISAKDGGWSSYRVNAVEAGAPEQKIEADRDDPKKVRFHTAVGEKERTTSSDLHEFSFVLDNLVFGHYAALIEIMNQRHSTSGQFTFVVPQASQTLDGSMRSKGAESGFLGSRKIDVDLLEIQFANILVLVRSSSDVAGHLLDVQIPSQRIVATRAGFVKGGAQIDGKLAPPAGVIEIETVVGAGTEFPLGATLTLPAARVEGVPGVVLVHGSGPQDRDETIGPNAPFRDIAWGLASRGIAVLRYEKRTEAHKGKMTGPLITLEQETIDDAVTAMELLGKRKEIDGTRIFVAGHSLGGFALPDILARAPRAAGGILLAGASRPLDKMVVEQVRYLGSKRQAPQHEVDSQAGELEKEFGRVRSGDAKDGESILGAPAFYWRDIFKRDPAARLARDPRPILALRGEKDYQVTAADLEGWKTAAAKAGKKNFESRTLSGLNHLFILIDGDSDGLDYQRPGRVDRGPLEAISSWIFAAAPTTPPKDPRSPGANPKK